MLSSELRTKLKRLRNYPIEFSPHNHCFSLRIDSDTTVVKRGLTRVLRQAFPVPRPTDDEQPTKRARRSPNDPVPAQVVWHRTAPLTPSAPTCREATLAFPVEGMSPDYGAAGVGPNFNKRHGIVVDEQLKLFVACGREALLHTNCVDPCVATLLDYFRAHGYALVASQVSLYSTELDLATKFDVVFTDRAARTELHLGEVKASLRSSADDAQYVKVRGRLRSSAARGTPLSDYSQHQLQLWIMQRMVRATLDGVAPHTSRILRVSANCVCAYALNQWYEDKAEKLLPALRKRGARPTKRGAGFMSK